MEAERKEKYRQSLENFVMGHTEDVLKQPREFIQYPFIDPGSVYDGNVWDWDTFWSVYGFLNLADKYGKDSVKESSESIADRGGSCTAGEGVSNSSESPAGMRERLIEHAKGNIRNFFDHQLEDGYIPMMKRF